MTFSEKTAYQNGEYRSGQPESGDVGSHSAANEPSADSQSGRVSDPSEWVHRYGDSLYRYAFSKLYDRGLAEEMVQETFLAGLKSRKGFQRQSSVSTWLFSILRHKLADHFRRPQNNQKVSGFAENLGSERAESEAELRSEERNHQRSNRNWDADPAAIYEDKEFWLTFDRCLDKLPNKLSEVYILREINEQSPKEIRELLGISATNLSMRLHRCRLAIRKCLEINWFDSCKSVPETSSNQSD